MSDTALGHETVHERNRFLRAESAPHAILAVVRVTEQQHNMTYWARTLL